MAKKEIKIPEPDLTQVTNLAHVDVETVMAGLVQMQQSSANEILADKVELKQSAVLNLKTGDLAMHESAVGMAQAENVDMQNGAAGAVRAENVFINGYAGLVAARSVEFGNTRVGVLASGEVRAEKIDSVILLTRKVEGNVTTLMDTRGALIAGLVGGLFAGIMLLLGRMLFGRKS